MRLYYPNKFNNVLSKYIKDYTILLMPYAIKTTSHKNINEKIKKFTYGNVLLSNGAKILLFLFHLIMYSL